MERGVEGGGAGGERLEGGRVVEWEGLDEEGDLGGKKWDLGVV